MATEHVIRSTFIGVAFVFLSYEYFVVSESFTGPSSTYKVRKEPRLYAAVDHMKPLVQIERRLVDIARTYLKEQKKKLSELAPFAQSVEEAMYMSEEDPERYLGNPINCYLIIKRFTSGWKELPSRLDLDAHSLKDIKDLLNANDMYLPSDAIDVHGATAAIIRLQDNYDLTAREISEGKIRGLKPSLHQLTAADCLDIADIVHKARRYVRMMEWLREAERLMTDPNLSHRRGNTTLLLVYEYLGWGHYLENNLTEALRYTEMLLKIDPTKSDAIENKKIYSWYVEKNVPCTQPETTYMEAARTLLEMGQRSNYVKVCKKRRMEPTGMKDRNNLRCFYRTNRPRLILKPLKVIQWHDNPEVYVLHDVLTDKQINKLKRLATPRLNVAEVMHPEMDTRIEADYRVSKSMFLQENYPKDVQVEDQLRGRFEDISGLSMVSAEQLQMNNYGLGGQYEDHHDYGEPGTAIESTADGNRIATLLLYLSDVESGGETVFTEIGLAIPPAKGDAVFWYNLYRNGTGFSRTKHASCPVISGSKWVANKWVHMGGNEFNRPCTLNQFE